MSRIKTKDSDLVGRLSDGSSDLSAKMKRGLSRTKDTVQDLADDGQVTPDEYAEDKVKNMSRDTAEDIAHDVKESADKAASRVKRKIRKKLEESSDKKREKCNSQDDADYEAEDGHDSSSSEKDKPESERKRSSKREDGSRHREEQTEREYHDGYDGRYRSEREVRRSNNQSRQRERSADAIKQTDRSTGRAKVKTVHRDIKTAGNTTGKAVKTTEQTTRTTVKTAQKTAKTAEHTAKAAKKTAEASAKAAKKSAEAAKKTAEATAKAVKVAVKAMVAAVKAIANGVKELVSLIVAGGWVSVVVILVIAMVGLVVCSAFGVFANDPTIGGRPMREIVAEINTEYYSRMENDANAIDIGDYDAKRICYLTDDDGDFPSNNWNDVIAVFSVLTTMDEDNPMDVVMLTDINTDYIRSIFYQMNTYDIRTGHDYDSELELEVLVVYVTQHTMSYIEAANHFNMNDSMRSVLYEMMSPKYYANFAELVGVDVYGGTNVNAILSGLSNDTGSNVVRAALTKLGAPYVRGSRGPNSFDCSGLAWWSLNQADPALASHFQGCAADQAHYCENMTVDRCELQPGDLIFWRNNECSGCGRWNEVHHVGIYAGQNKVIEASNSKGRVVLRDVWSSDSYEIYMCARPYETP